MIDANTLIELLARFETPSGLGRPGRLSDTEIDALESRIEIRVPDELRQWLKISNGALVGTVPLYGAHPFGTPLSMERYLAIYPMWREKKWIPIADDGCGNYYVIATQGEFGEGFPVVFIEAVVDCIKPAYIVASDLGHFLVFLMESELTPIESAFARPSWPFDEQAVVRDDPAILNFHGVPLPWEADKASER